MGDDDKGFSGYAYNVSKKKKRYEKSQLEQKIFEEAMKREQDVQKNHHGR